MVGVIRLSTDQAISVHVDVLLCFGRLFQRNMASAIYKNVIYERNLRQCPQKVYDFHALLSPHPFCQQSVSFGS